MQLIFNAENSTVDIEEMSKTKKLSEEETFVANEKLENVKTTDKFTVPNSDDSFLQKEDIQNDKKLVDDKTAKQFTIANLDYSILQIENTQNNEKLNNVETADDFTVLNSNESKLQKKEKHKKRQLEDIKTVKKFTVTNSTMLQKEDMQSDEMLGIAKTPENPPVVNSDDTILQKKDMHNNKKLEEVKTAAKLTILNSDDPVLQQGDMQNDEMLDIVKTADKLIVVNSDDSIKDKEDMQNDEKLNKVKTTDEFTVLNSDDSILQRKDIKNDGKLEDVKSAEIFTVTSSDDSMLQRVDSKNVTECQSYFTVSSQNDIFEDALDCGLKENMSLITNDKSIESDVDVNVLSEGTVTKDYCEKRSLNTLKVNREDPEEKDLIKEEEIYSTKINEEACMSSPVKCNDTLNIFDEKATAFNTCNNQPLKNSAPELNVPLLKSIVTESVEKHFKVSGSSEVYLDTFDEEKMDVDVNNELDETINDGNSNDSFRKQVKSDLAQESSNTIVKDVANVIVKVSKESDLSTMSVVNNISQWTNETSKQKDLENIQESGKDSVCSEDLKTDIDTCTTNTINKMQETIDKVFVVKDIFKDENDQAIAKAKNASMCDASVQCINNSGNLELYRKTKSLNITEDTNKEYEEDTLLKATENKNFECLAVQEPSNAIISMGKILESSEIQTALIKPKSNNVINLEDISQNKEINNELQRKNVSIFDNKINHDHTSKETEFTNKIIVENTEVQNSVNEKCDKTIENDFSQVEEIERMVVEENNLLNKNIVNASEKDISTIPKITYEINGDDNVDLMNGTEKKNVTQLRDLEGNVETTNTKKCVEVQNTENTITPMDITDVSKINLCIRDEPEKCVVQSSPEPQKDVINDKQTEYKTVETKNIDQRRISNSNDAVMFVGETNETDIQKDTPEVTVKSFKNLTPTIKLSNTLNILSDDEEEPNKTDSENRPKIIMTHDTNEKQCINVEDDDDIMVIDDDSTSKVEKDRTAKIISSGNDKIKDIEPPNKVLGDKDKSKEIIILNKPEIKEGSHSALSENENKKSAVSEVVDTETKPSETSTTCNKMLKSLVPSDFFKSYRKNLEEMTRDDLEEFCIVKIVEGIVDRSGLSDLRSKLKTMTQSIEEYKKKTMMLTKQNRDLQVVLKSIQEAQKKAGDFPITPLKITRSVGMQVLMTEKSRKKPITMSASNSTSNTRQSRSPNLVNVRSITSPVVARPHKANTNQIPVPRLVPASNTAVAKSNNTSQASLPKNVSPAHNATKVSSVQKAAEKRTHNRIQSVTVDLTDDEPPAKTPTKTPSTPPVRLVPSQNLMAPRQQVPQNVNSPRKVFIPIGSNQPRPGSIMLRPVHGPRPRNANAMVRFPPNNIRPAKVPSSRQPPPLPDAMKQYQPPNWKALPPAPDLKLSKVENGIVISWKIEGYQEDSYEEIASYQLYAYQETSTPASTALWKKIGDVKALPLPMACTLTQFMAGFKYYFAVRAVDIRSRLGPFSLPGSILLLNKM